MSRQKWSCNAIASELGIDRRTVTRRLHELKAAGNGPRGPLYWMKDVYRELTNNSYWSLSDRKDLVARSFIEHVGKHGNLEALAERVTTATSPEARTRALREFFASQLWGFIRDRKDPACPEWASASERSFERAWRALVRDREPLAEVEALLVGSKRPGAAGSLHRSDRLLRTR